LHLRDLARSAGTAEVRTLTFRDAEIFAYGGGNIFSSYDRRIWDLYSTKTAEEAYRLLQRKGISHLYMPNYSSPTNYFNGIGEMLGRRDLLRIANQSESSVFTLFEVAREPGGVTAEEIFHGALSEAILLRKRAFDLFPTSLASCDALRVIYGDIFHWYLAQ